MVSIAVTIVELSKNFLWAENTRWIFDLRVWRELGEVLMFQIHEIVQKGMLHLDQWERGGGRYDTEHVTATTEGVQLQQGTSQLQGESVGCHHDPGGGRGCGPDGQEWTGQERQAQNRAPRQYHRSPNRRTIEQLPQKLVQPN